MADPKEVIVLPEGSGSAIGWEDVTPVFVALFLIDVAVLDIVLVAKLCKWILG